MNLFKQRMLIILLPILLMGCQDKEINEDSKPELIEVESKYSRLSNEVIEQDMNIGIYNSEESYSLPITRLKAVLANKGKAAVEYGNPIYLDKLKNGVWVQIPYRDDFDFTMEAFQLKPGETFEQGIATEDLNYELTVGE